MDSMRFERNRRDGKSEIRLTGCCMLVLCTLAHTPSVQKHFLTLACSLPSALCCVRGSFNILALPLCGSVASTLAADLCLYACDRSLIFVPLQSNPRFVRRQHVVQHKHWRTESTSLASVLGVCVGYAHITIHVKPSNSNHPGYVSSAAWSHVSQSQYLTHGERRLCDKRTRCERPKAAAK